MSDHTVSQTLQVLKLHESMTREVHDALGAATTDAERFLVLQRFRQMLECAEEASRGQSQVWFAAAYRTIRHRTP